jgi:hypothetical protein
MNLRTPAGDMVGDRTRMSRQPRYSSMNADTLCFRLEDLRSGSEGDVAATETQYEPGPWSS